MLFFLRGVFSRRSRHLDLAGLMAASLLFFYLILQFFSVQEPNRPKKTTTEKPVRLSQPSKQTQAFPKDLEQRLRPLEEEEEYPQGKLGKKQFFDRLLLKKNERRLYAYSKNTLLRVYPVALGKNPTGHRRLMGDNRTPEGIYSIHFKDDSSVYHKSLRLSYPNAQDIYYAQENKLPLPEAVFIHGLTKDTAFLGEAHRVSDWTDGSIALSNAAMDELFAHTPLGIPLEILP